MQSRLQFNVVFSVSGCAAVAFLISHLPSVVRRIVQRFLVTRGTALTKNRQDDRRQRSNANARADHNYLVFASVPSSIHKPPVLSQVDAALLSVNSITLQIRPGPFALSMCPSPV